MLHGYSADKNLWLRFARHFVSDYRVVIPDLAGHGETGFKAGGGYDIPTQARRVIELAHLVTYADDAKFAANVGRFLDLDQVARYMAVTVFLSTLDSILYTGQNYYLYLDPTSDRFRIIPWDLDHAFGSAFAGGAQLAKLSIRKPWVGPNRFLERLFALHSMDEARAFRLLARAREEGVTWTVMSNTIRDLLAGDGCTVQHIEMQIRQVEARFRPWLRE